MRQADHRGLGDIGMAHRRVFELDRADPLAPDLITSLLRSTICMQPRHRSSPRRRCGTTLGVERCLTRAFVLVIGADDPWSAHQQLAACDPVLGEAFAVRVDDLDLDPVERPALAARIAYSASRSSAICLGFGFERLPTGLISVMPQPWIKVTP